MGYDKGVPRCGPKKTRVVGDRLGSRYYRVAEHRGERCKLDRRGNSFKPLLRSPLPTILTTGRSDKIAQRLAAHLSAVAEERPNAFFLVLQVSPLAAKLGHARSVTSVVRLDILSADARRLGAHVLRELELLTARPLELLHISRRNAEGVEE